MNSILAQLHDSHQIWHGNNHHLISDSITTGDTGLDDYLHGGWPEASVIELQSINGIGELRLLMPYLASQAQSTRLVAFIAPPSQLGSQMLASNELDTSQVLVLYSQRDNDILWSVEQCLKSGCVGVIVLWHQQFTSAQIKRFKLAAEQGQASLIIIRHQPNLSLCLPVQLSLSLAPHQHGLMISINKQLGHWSKAPYLLDMRKQWPDLVTPVKPSNVIELSQRKVG